VMLQDSTRLRAGHNQIGLGDAAAERRLTSPVHT